MRTKNWKGLLLFLFCFFFFFWVLERVGGVLVILSGHLNITISFRDSSVEASLAFDLARLWVLLQATWTALTLAHTGSGFQWIHDIGN